MSRICTVCAHPERAEIDAALVAGTPYRSIAQRFAASPDAVLRHKREHLPAHLAQAQEASEVAQADDLLAQVRSLQAKALGILATAEQADDLRTALMAIREALGGLELLIAPEWLSVRTALLRALAPYVEARAAVAAALLQLEASNGHLG